MRNRKRTPAWSEHAAEWRDRVVILAETWQRALAAEGSERAAMLAWASRVSRAARGLASERETHLVLTLAARGDRTNG